MTNSEEAELINDWLTERITDERMAYLIGIRI